MSEHILAGVVGGLVGTVAMTVVMMPLMKGQPSMTQRFASRFLNDKRPEDNQGIGMVLHVVYGALMGLVLVLVLEALSNGVATFETVELVLDGAGWGVVLFLGSVAWMMVLGMVAEMKDASGAQKAMMMSGNLLAHLVYGGVLGWVVALMVG